VLGHENLPYHGTHLTEMVVWAQANPRQAFWEWVARHDKSYSNNLEVGWHGYILQEFWFARPELTLWWWDVQEFEQRFQNWVNNLEYVLEYNSKHTSHWVSMDEMAHIISALAVWPH
jgi:hypothetical protein